MAQDIPPAAEAPSFAAGEAGQLQLEVYINDVSTDLIATFRQNDAGSLLIEPDQLKNIGISPVESAVSADGWIDVCGCPR